MKSLFGNSWKDFFLGDLRFHPFRTCLIEKCDYRFHTVVFLGGLQGIYIMVLVLAEYYHMWVLVPLKDKIGKQSPQPTVTIWERMAVYEHVVEYGTGKRAKVGGHQIAGKTGTTQGFKDSIFVGYIKSSILYFCIF